MGRRAGALTRSTAAAMVAAGWVAIVACSTEYSGPYTTECSTGPVHLTHPPPAKASPFDSIPECVPRCGASEKYRGGSFAPIYSLAALPSGACANDEERCGMTAGAIRVCPDETRACDLSGFECECTGGAWRCFTTAQGAGVCGTCPSALDASANGG